MQDERLAVQRMFREVLLRRGFNYCDEGVEQDTEPPPRELRGEALLEEGLAAGSSDHPTQSVRQTLEDNGATFWSSRGSPSPDADDWLLYKMRGPVCLVTCVQLVVFRARYQFGEPIYPPSYVSFQVGTSTTRLGPPTPRYPVRASSHVQSFLLPASCPAGRYLRVNLHGRRQRQVEDMQWYIAIERVEALGHPLPPSDLALLRCWSQGAAPLAPCSGCIPAYVAATTLRSLKDQAPQEQQEEEEEVGRQAESEVQASPGPRGRGQCGSGCRGGGGSGTAGEAGSSGEVRGVPPEGLPHPEVSGNGGAAGQQRQQQVRRQWVPGESDSGAVRLMQAPEQQGGLPGWLGLLRLAEGEGLGENEEGPGEDDGPDEIEESFGDEGEGEEVDWGEFEAQSD